MKKNRVVHITLQKCGSQWVRDVLTAPEIIHFSGVAHSGVTMDIGFNKLIDLPYNTFSGPIYGMSQWEWKCWKQDGDKAIVVLRDPRDLLVSLIYSILYSHSSDSFVDTYKNIILNLPDEDRFDFMMLTFGGSAARMFLTWSDALSDSSMLIKYEDLIENQFSEFSHILKWLGWNVPNDTLHAVINRLSFKNRSGRAPGIENKFSHYRKGVSGDWKNHFSRRHGQLWESLFPGLLKAIGYETDNDWWSALPEKQGTEDSQINPQTKSVAPNNIHYETLEYRNQYLEKELIEKEQVIRSLAKACEERLTLINSLVAKQG